MRNLMDQISAAQRDFVAQAPVVIPFPGPHYGVHIRRWGSGPEITIECDPGYCGIGATLSAREARGLGEALIRAAETIGAGRPAPTTERRENNGASSHDAR